MHRINERLGAWINGASDADGEALAVVLQHLAVGLYEHMGLEEKLALPPCERHIFASEWEAMVASGAAGTRAPPRSSEVGLGLPSVGVIAAAAGAA